MTRTPLIAGNWKMNLDTKEATELVQNIIYAYDKTLREQVEVLICPPFTDLRSARVVLGFDKSPILLGAQNVYWESAGAYTGEISAPMLAELGCAYCIVGHSERREQFCETDANVNRKAKALLASGVAPIICCGESLEQRESGAAIEHVTAQVAAALQGISAADAAKTVIAYEPIWAIGTGKTATPEIAQEVAAAIRAKLQELYGEPTAQAIRILYGGSMKPGNAAEFAPKPDIDGGLIGGAALDATSFLALADVFAGC
jgi:triosephosphate isomerase